MLKLYLDMIPFDNGNATSLIQFISSFDLVHSSIGETNDQQLKTSIKSNSS